MLPRPTARVLLLDAAHRLLLIHMHDPQVGGASGAVLRDPYWVTIGGGVEPGETLADAAQREIMEETGLTQARLGPIVWYTEHVLTIGGEKRLMQESFFIAHTGRTDAGRDGWTAQEREVIRDMRWWAVPDLLESGDMFFPSSLKHHLPGLIDGVYPSPPLRIDP